MKLYDTLIDLLAEAKGRDRQIRFIDGESDESVVEFADLWTRALALLGALQARGVQHGDELVIFSKSNEKFLIAFWAAILGGIVPVPVAVGISDEHRFKLFRILRQLERGTLFTERSLLDRLLEFSKQRDLDDVTSILDAKTVVMSDVQPGDAGETVEIGPGDPAFIQYSSGSTSDPKGVCLTHRNLCHNIRAIVEGTGWQEHDVSLSWMPLTHDMGLIGMHLATLGVGMQHALMSTDVFVRRPLLWLIKASELKATQLCSPNFGYKHFLKLYGRRGLPEGTDLSCIKNIYNGAEPISWDLCEEFLTALAPHGLKHNTMTCVYGLAEATVAVAFPAPADEPERIVVDRHKLRIGDRYESVEPSARDALSFVCVGTAVRDTEIRIADDSEQLLADGQVGHIQLRGAAVTDRVYGDPDATAKLFTDDGWLRTGDCGVIADGQLVITGRQKDLIIVNGQNYYPHDLEDVLSTIGGLELGKVAVAGATPTGSGTEELLVFVLFRQGLDEFFELASRVREKIGEDFGLDVEHVIPVSRIPKTTSGKVQRAHLLRDYLDGAFHEVLAELAPASSDVAELDADPLVAELETICREFSKERIIGPDDNLFEVGVSSLTLTEIVLAVDEKYPDQLDISDLFDYPTLREVAGLLREKQSGKVSGKGG